VQTIEISSANDLWLVNSLAVAPGELIMPEGTTSWALDALAKHGLTWTIISYGKMQLNGGGNHCSTTPLIRDKI
jgi:arginine deiminase